MTKRAAVLLPSQLRHLIRVTEATKAQAMEISVMYGEDAQALRKRCGLTQEELGSLWNKSRVQIGRYEKARQVVEPPGCLGLPGVGGRACTAQCNIVVA